MKYINKIIIYTAFCLTQATFAMMQSSVSDRYLVSETQSTPSETQSNQLKEHGLVASIKYCKINYATKLRLQHQLGTVVLKFIGLFSIERVLLAVDLEKLPEFIEDTYHALPISYTPRNIYSDWENNLGENHCFNPKAGYYKIDFFFPKRALRITDNMNAIIKAAWEKALTKPPVMSLVPSLNLAPMNLGLKVKLPAPKEPKEDNNYIIARLGLFVSNTLM